MIRKLESENLVMESLAYMQLIFLKNKDQENGTLLRRFLFYYFFIFLSYQITKSFTTSHRCECYFNNVLLFITNLHTFCISQISKLLITNNIIDMEN